MSKVGGNSEEESARAKESWRKLKDGVERIKRSFPLARNEKGELGSLGALPPPPHCTQ